MEYKYIVVLATKLKNSKRGSPRLQLRRGSSMTADRTKVLVEGNIVVATGGHRSVTACHPTVTLVMGRSQWSTVVSK